MPPADYKLIPKGVRCSCPALWREADGSYWCCGQFEKYFKTPVSESENCLACRGFGYFTHLGEPIFECVKCDGRGRTL